MSDASAQGILMPYQVAWLNDDSPVIVWEKSRRIGASFVDSLKSVLLAAKKMEDGGMNVNYLSYNKHMTQQYIQDAAFWAKKIGAAAGVVQEVILKDDDRDIITYQIKFSSGHKIQALSSHPRSLRSTKGRVVLDEFAFVDAPAELLKAALALGMWGGQVAVMSTHNGADNPFYELVQNIRSGKLPYTLHRTDFNEAVDQGLYKAVCRSLKKAWTPEDEEAYKANIVSQYGEAADEELFCIPRKSGGAFIPLNLIETAMEGGDPTVIIRVSPPAEDFVDWPRKAIEAWTALFIAETIEPRLAGLHKKLRHTSGVDVGRLADLTVIWVLAEEENLDLSTPLIIEMSNLPFKVQEAVMRAVEYGLPGFAGQAVDAGGIGASLAEASRQEWGPELIHEVKFSESWYSANLPPLKGRFEDEAISLPPDVHLRDDLRQIKVINGIPKLDSVRVKTAGGQRHGDAAIALALAHFALKNAPDISYWEPTFAEPGETVGLLERFNR